jgi:hypothetical protein
LPQAKLLRRLDAREMNAVPAMTEIVCSCAPRILFESEKTTDIVPRDDDRRWQRPPSRLV